MARTATARRTSAAALAVVLTAGACGADTDEGPDAAVDEEVHRTGFVGEQEAGEPVSGGTLTFADYSEARSLDPVDNVAHGASGGNPLAAVYDVLVRYDPEAEGFEPWLAEDIESDDDFLTWTLTLREDTEFGDGTPLDADAVVASIERYIEEGGSDAATLEPHIDRIEAEDDTTVVFHLTTPWSTFPSLLSQGAGMVVAPAALEGEEFEPVGAGPFELERYAPQEELVLTAREDYWQGAPHLDAVRFIWPQGDEAKVDALEEGSVDAAFLRTPAEIESAHELEYRGYSELNSLGNALLVNHAEGRPGEDPRVREAIALALDPEVTYERAHEGAGVPFGGLFSEQSRWSTGVELPGHDQERASELLAEAVADGYDAELTYLGGADGNVGRNEAMAAKALLESVGFTVELDLVPSIADRIQRMFADKDFDIARGALSISEADPFQGLYRNLSAGSPINSGSYDNPEMEGLLAELQGAPTDGERQEVLTRIEEEWLSTVPHVGEGAGLFFVPWQEDVHGIEASSETLLLLGGAWMDR
ncbi:ABC transporter substrate-binding protein [Nocardiopsis sp. HNM0947]|uniref:ABC transporter substrate-binding protein n=1 Tax=Nocardiopsis coralli TaxID=2772213 RepID=A0ABR9NZT1_9ACTN|nr:ABC transporter substrate-binding protein [Nocardiopsis coralli]MBE2997089.1 ABC transporter substrate-binding protein [Nocardiopsis coralli]